MFAIVVLARIMCSNGKMLESDGNLSENRGESILIVIVNYPTKLIVSSASV